MDFRHDLGVTDVFSQLAARPEGLTATNAMTAWGSLGVMKSPGENPFPAAIVDKQFANYFILVLLFAAILAFTVSFLPGESGRR